MPLILGPQADGDKWPPSKEVTLLLVGRLLTGLATLGSPRTGRQEPWAGLVEQVRGIQPSETKAQSGGDSGAGPLSVPALTWELSTWKCHFPSESRKA